MIDTSGVEDFLTWVNRRHLCIVHCIENAGGNFWLSARKWGEEYGFQSVNLPLESNRIVIFRNDCMQYSYQPEGNSIAMQSWLMSAPTSFSIRTLARPPRLDLAQLHIMSIMERFPLGCFGADKVWAMFVGGTDGLTMPAASRFEYELYYMADRDAIQFGKAYTMHGSFVEQEHLVCFDNSFFGVTDEDAMAMSIQQRWILETGYDALHKAGYTKQSLNGARIGTFIGDSGAEWSQVNPAGLSKYTLEDDACSFTVGRLAYCLGLRGPCCHCDTACSASMVGVNAACNMMRPGRHADTQHLTSAICMGILAMVSPSGWIGECASTMLSFEGRCKTFNSTADGFIRGEGCTAINIQQGNPLADDQWETSGRLAVMYGTACNQDGRSASLTAPSGPSQQECIRISLRQAQINPAEVGFGECHGTGTALGDPIEVGANKAVFTVAGRENYPHKLVTAKSHLGHLEACAGVCGLAKTTLMLIHQVTTPNCHLHNLNAHLDLVGYPVMMTNELTDTFQEGSYGGISSFGFGGTNTRGDVWARALRGTSRKNGKKAVLERDEAKMWISRALDGEEMPTASKPKLSVDFAAR